MPAIYQLMPVDRYREPRSSAPGLSLRFTWTDWAADCDAPDPEHPLIRYVDWCQRHSRPYLLHPLAGRHSPSYAADQTVRLPARPNQAAAFVPQPTDFHEAELAGWLRAVAQWFGDDPLWHGWAMPGFRDSSELHSHGLDSALVISACFSRIDAMREAAPDRQLILNWSTIEGGQLVLEHAGHRGCGLQHNALKANTSPTWATHQAVAAHRPHGFQAACPSGNTERFGGTLARALRIAQRSGAEWLELYAGDIDPALQFFNQG